MCVLTPRMPRKMVLREDTSGEAIHVLHRVLPPAVPIHYCFVSVISAHTLVATEFFDALAPQPDEPHIVALDHPSTTITAVIPQVSDQLQTPAHKPSRRRCAGHCRGGVNKFNDSIFRLNA